MEKLLEHFKVYDIEVTPRSSNHFVDIMASLGYSLLQNPFIKVTHMEVIIMYKSSLESPLYQEEVLSSAQVNELNVLSKHLWYQHIKEYLNWVTFLATMSTIKKC